MPLAPGSRIGAYDVVEMVGVGGMGEVYRARDARLERDVALKTLPEEFSRDPERLARFEREAKSLAQLNHPHIASIYGLEAGTPTALAMEMVEGETLADRLKAGPLPLDEAMVIARQMCAALDHAHGRGIVHRDLKPANIKAGPRDTAPNVKILDFGLAKALGQGSGIGDQGSGIGDQGSGSVVSSPTITSPANMTRAGIILGTAAYMAPEQARGKQVDQRADIWAFGCVLFEMLTGRRAFDGEEMTDVLARVIQSEPDWALLPQSTPRAIKTVLQRCLRKDPTRRIHSIADVGIDLEEAGAESAQAEMASSPAPRRPAWVSTLGGAAIGAAVVAATMLAIGVRRPVEAAPTFRLTLSMPDGWTLFRAGNGRLSFAVSPDGEKVAAVLAKGSERRLFIRRLADTAFSELNGTTGASGVFWAPDSERLAFIVRPGGIFRKTDLKGSGSQQIAAIPQSGLSAAWGPDDEVLSVQQQRAGPLLRWSVTSPAPRPVDEPVLGVTATSPGWLPSGHGFLYVDVGPEVASVMVRRPSEAPRQLTTMGADSQGWAQYRSDHLLLASSDASGRSVLTAQPLDLATAKLTGEATVLATDVNPSFSASENGVLVYGPGRIADERFVWVDARGTVDATQGTAAQLRRPVSFDLSADQRFIVAQQMGNSNPLSLHDLVRGVTTTMTVKGVDPVWSPDGKQIAFSTTTGTGNGVHIVPAFGGASRLLYSQAEPIFLDDWSRDGRWLAGHLRIDGPGILIPTSGDGKPILFEDQSSGQGVDEATFSPDGKWLAYNLNAGGASDVHLAAVPPTGEVWKVSQAGGAQPRWRTDGKALYFLSLSGTMMTVDVQTRSGEPPQISAPQAVFETGLLVAPGVDQYRVSADGKRFLLRRPDESSAAGLNRLEVIVNWPGLIKK